MGQNLLQCNFSFNQRCFERLAGTCYDVAKPKKECLCQSTVFTNSPNWYKDWGQTTAADGFDVVESYPRMEFENATCGYMGTARMYEKFGFTVVDEINGELVMQKSLT
ncbi:MAG: hypothetical protein PHP02_05430 [Eubacteriales bacterium]|nr:hypothetical protein [Eubacteriales bacterium]